MTGLEKAQEHRRNLSAAKRSAVLQAIRAAVARGEVPTPSSIARAAGVDRSIFYGERGQTLRAELDLAVAQLQAEVSAAVNTATRVTAATLRADLANATELNRRLRSQIASLEAILGRHLGDQILADLPATDRIAIVADPQIEAKIDELTLLNDEHQAEIQPTHRRSRRRKGGQPTTHTTGQRPGRRTTLSKPPAAVSNDWTPARHLWSTTTTPVCPAQRNDHPPRPIENDVERVMVDVRVLLGEVADHPGRGGAVHLPHRRRCLRHQHQEHPRPHGVVGGQVFLRDPMLASTGLAVDDRHLARPAPRLDPTGEPARHPHQMVVVQLLVAAVCATAATTPGTHPARAPSGSRH